MFEKSKRKRGARRPLWQVLSAIVLVIVLAGIGAYVYPNTSPANDGEDIVFLRATDRETYNLYALDIDNEEAEARILTDNENSDARISAFDVSPDGTWLIYDEQIKGTTLSQLTRLDIETGERSIILDCSVEPLVTCWEPKLSPDGKTVLFGAADNKEIFEGIGILDLSSPDAVAEPLFQAGSWETFWLGNDRILTKRWEDETKIFYNIQTGEIEPYESESHWPSVSMDGSRITESLFSYDESSGVPRWDYLVLNTENNEAMSYQLPIGEPQVPIIAWNPDNTKMLISSTVSGEDAEYDQIYLFDAETQETSLLFDRKEYRVRELVWNPDGTQFAMLLQPVKDYNQEGQIWIYDMQSGEAIPTNEIGLSVQWLNS